MTRQTRKLTYKERRDLARKDAIPVNVRDFEAEVVDQNTVRLFWDEKKAHCDYVQVDYSTDFKNWIGIIRLPYEGKENFIEHEVKPGKYVYRVSVKKITNWAEYLYDAVEITKDDE